MPTIDEIVKTVCLVTNVPREEIMGKGRSERIANTRFICFHLALKLAHHTTVSTGIYFNKDHGTVMNGRDRAKELILTDAKFRNTVATIESILMNEPKTEPAQNILVWTRKTPTREGWYFFRTQPGGTIVGLVLRNRVELVLETCKGYSKVSGIAGEWAGPIPEPQDPPPFKVTGTTPLHNPK